MTPIAAFLDIAKALPKSYIEANKNHAQTWHIIDKDKQAIGDINLELGRVTIYESYEYSDQVVEAIGAEKFEVITEEFHVPSKAPVKTETDPPDLSEYGRKLYEDQNSKK